MSKQPSFTLFKDIPVANLLPGRILSTISVVVYSLQTTTFIYSKYNKKEPPHEKLLRRNSVLSFNPVPHFM